MLESGNKENFQKGTEEYHGWTTDQGIDEKAVDAVKCYPDTFGDPGDLSVAESSMDNGEDRLGSCHSVSPYIFRNALTCQIKAIWHLVPFQA